MERVYRIIRKAQNQYYIGFVCSRCDSARMLLVTANIEQTNRTGTRKPDPRESAMLSNAYKTIQTEIARRGKAGESLLNDFSIGVDFGRASVKLDGIDFRCPLCGQREPWQTVLRIEDDYAKLKSENYPQVWMETSDAERWLDEFQKSRVLLYREYWHNNPQSYQRIKAEKNALKQEVSNIKQLLSNLPEEQQLQNLQNYITQITDAKNRCPLFSANRTDLSQKLRSSRKEEARIIKSLSEQKKQYAEEISLLENKYKALSTANKGIDEKLTELVTDGDKNMCWYLE